MLTLELAPQYNNQSAPAESFKAVSTVIDFFPEAPIGAVIPYIHPLWWHIGLCCTVKLEVMRSNLYLAGHISMGEKCKNAQVPCIGCMLKKNMWSKLIWSPPLRHASNHTMVLACKTPESNVNLVYES